MLNAAGPSPFRAGMWGKVWAPLILVVLTIGLGWVGFYRFYAAVGNPMSAWDALFFAAGLPLQETAGIDRNPELIPLSLQIARFLGLFVIPYAFVLAFLVLFGNVTRPLRIRSWSWARNPGRRAHSIVCGLGWKGHELARDLIAKGERVAVVERDPENPLIAATRQLGAIVIVGDATQLSVLRAVHIAAARRIFVVCGSDEINARIVKQISLLSGSRTPRSGTVECSVEIESPRMREFVHRTLATDRTLSINSFDTFETTARQLFEAYPIDRFRPGGDIEEVHVVLIGFSAMSRALLLQAVLLGHFPPGRSLRLRVLTEDAGRAEAEFLNEHPYFRPPASDDQLEAEVLRRQVLPRCEFFELPESDALLLDEEGALLSTIAAGSATSIYVCLDDGLRSAAYLAAVLPSLGAVAADRGADVQAFYYYNDPEDEHGLLVERNLCELAPSLPIKAFGNFLEGCSVDAVEGRPADDMARQIAARYRRKYGGEEWHSLSESDRMSNRHAADHVSLKLRMIGAEIVPRAEADPDFEFTEAEIALLADVEHRRWSAERFLSGWRPLPRTPENLSRWEREKSVLKAQKLHPDLVPFDRFDEVQKGKDRSQIVGIPDFLQALGLGIRRRTQPSVADSPASVRLA